MKYNTLFKYISPGLKVYFWLWEHLCYQVEISRRTAKILGAQLKTGLKVNDQLVAHATRFVFVRLKNHVRSHLRA